MYNYRMFDYFVIFEIMYKIMIFGYGGLFIFGCFVFFDMLDDFFWICLIVIILEICGVFFNKGVVGKKLDYFFFFF